MHSTNSDHAATRPPPKRSGQPPKQTLGQHIGRAVTCQGESRAGPTSVLKVERGEGSDRSECQRRQRQTGAERRDPADHLRKRQALSTRRGDCRNETRYRGGERGNRDHAERNRREAAGYALRFHQRDADWSADRDGGVEADADPHHDFSGILRADRADPPCERAGHHQTLGKPGYHSRGKEQRQRRHRAERCGRRSQIDRAGQDRYAAAENDAELRAAAIAQAAGELARQYRDKRLQADGDADGEIVEAENVVNLERKRGERHADR